MFRRLPLYLCLVLLTQCSQCKRDDPQPAPPQNPVSLLPPETQTGQRTFGCLVNGQAWTPAGNPFGVPSLSAEYYKQNFYLYASRTIVMNGLNTTQSIQIEIDSIDQKGVYILENAAGRSLTFSDREHKCFFVTDKSHPATVEVTRMDLVNRIVSGRFSFTLETPSCGQITVTDGRFDTRF